MQVTCRLTPIGLQNGLTTSRGVATGRTTDASEMMQAAEYSGAPGTASTRRRRRLLAHRSVPAITPERSETCTGTGMADVASMARSSDPTNLRIPDRVPDDQAYCPT